MFFGSRRVEGRFVACWSLAREEYQVCVCFRIENQIFCVLWENRVLCVCVDVGCLCIVCLMLELLFWES